MGMNTGIELILVVSGVLLLLSVLASRASGRFGVPALLIFIGIGMLAGSEGPGGIQFENYYLSYYVGTAALAAILFDGGLRTEWSRIKPVLWQGVSLSSAGVLITALVSAVLAKLLFPFSWIESLLLASIISSTDAAAVFSILRSKNSTLKGRTQPLLELESGSNDPMAVFLTIGFVQLASRPDLSAWTLLPTFVQQLVLGAVFGYAGATIVVWSINRLKLEYEGLYPVYTTAAMILLFSVTSSLGGSGFLAIYLAGIFMGRSNFIHKNSLIRFHDGVAWMAQIAMFLTLGLLVFPSHLLSVAFSGTAMALFLVLVARPVSAWICLAGSGFSLKEKTMVSWVGLRGAAPIILATIPFLAGLPQAELMFNVVFFVVLVSVLIQGMTIPWVAERLGLSAPIGAQKRSPIELESGSLAKLELSELEIPRNSSCSGRAIVDLNIPRTALIILITRGKQFLIPRGETVLENEDTLLVLADREDLAIIQKIITTTRSEVDTPSAGA